MAEAGAEAVDELARVKASLEESQKALEEAKSQLEAEKAKNETLEKEKAELAQKLQQEAGKAGSGDQGEQVAEQKPAENSGAGTESVSAVPGGGEASEETAARTRSHDVQAAGVQDSASRRPVEDMSLEELRTELQKARDKISEMEEYQMELDGVADQLHQQLEEERSLRGLGDDELYQAQEKKMKEKDKVIKQLKADIAHLEEEVAQTSLKNSPRKEGDDAGEIPYDVLDRLDDELARAKEQLLERESECSELKNEIDGMRKQVESTDEWRESAVQAQHECRMVKDDLRKALKDGAEEQHMRQALEARFDEKLKLKTREIEHLSNEVDRLKRTSEQVSPILTELENLKLESRQKMEHKNREISRLQSALQVAEAERQKADNEIRNMKMDIEQWERRVKNAEEVRWRAGMNLAKAKAEMDWRQKADQEKDFFMERMKEELTRLKNKLMRTEMRKLKVEESLEETVMELRGKKREMEQMKARVDGLVRAMQVQPSGM